MPISMFQGGSRRLTQLDQTYRTARDPAYQAFNQAFDAAMRKHNQNLTLNANGVASLTQIMSFSQDFHNDPDLTAAREALQAAVNSAEQERAAGARELPHSRLRFARQIAK